MITAEEIIKRFSLQPHPEGGWYKRTYQSNLQVESFNGSRPVGSSILYLLKPGEVSRLHYLDADETWYFHQGNPLQLHLFSEDSYDSILLGNISQNVKFHAQYTVGAKIVFGVTPYGNSEESFSLVSCSVSPGFIKSGFSWPDICSLQAKFEKYSDLIEKLCPPVES